MILVNTLIYYSLIIKFMSNLFTHKLALLDSKDNCSLPINGIMRQDETAVLIHPDYKNFLADAYKIRFFKTSSEPCDYLIKNYYRDKNRPLSKKLIRPIVILLDKVE